MWKYLFLICVSIFWCSVWYSLVFWGNLNFSTDIQFWTTIWNQVILGDEDLSHAIVVYTSNVNLSKFEVHSLCESESKFLTSHKDLYFFEIHYTWDTCSSNSIVLKEGETIYGNTAKNIEILSKNTLLGTYIDYSTGQLEEKKRDFKSIISDTAIYKNYSGKELIKYLKYALGQRKYAEAFFHHSLIQEIISGREKKYVTPVLGRSLSTLATKIPNSPRPYRQTYTDGIHHWWDIDGSNGDTTIALDDGLIVRIVEWFNNATDFSKIVYWDNLSYEQKLKNLDVLRWNQVWLKTLKWDVIFYSHLQSISGEIKEWTYVSKWTVLWTTWVSWVPEIGYDDYHLHFAVMKNPYNIDMAGTYDFWDYMAWDWYGKWMNYEQTVELQRNTFE